MKQAGDLWCILRTSPGRTLALVASLRESGIDAWTPRQTLKVRRPRSNATTERDVPIMPTFAFARAGFVYDLIEEAGDPRSQHPRFSVFHANQRIPLIAHQDIERLMQEERRVAPKAKQKVYAAGDRVALPDGPFAGMSGVAEQGDGTWTVVAFGGSFRVKIATFLLREDGVSGGGSDVDMAA